MLDDLLLVIALQVDAVGEMRWGHRHRSYPHSSTAPRFTAGAAGFLKRLSVVALVSHAGVVHVLPAAARAVWISVV
jgi:hypothetical protein